MPLQGYQHPRSTGLRAARAQPRDFMAWTSDETQVVGTASRIGQHANALVQARTDLLRRLVRANGRDSSFTVHPRRPFDAILTRVDRKSGVIKSEQKPTRSRICSVKTTEKHRSLLRKRAMGNSERVFPSKEQHPSLSIHIQDPEPKSRLKYLMATRMAQQSLAAYHMSKEYGWGIVQNEDYGINSEDAGAERHEQQRLERGSVRAKEVATALIRLKASFPVDFESITVDSEAVSLALHGPPAREIDGQSCTRPVAGPPGAIQVDGLQQQTAENDRPCFSNSSSPLPMAEETRGLQTQGQSYKVLKAKAKSALRLISRRVSGLSERISRGERETCVDGSEEDSDDEYADLELSWKENQFSQMRLAAWLDGIITEEQSNNQQDDNGSGLSQTAGCQVEKAHETTSQGRWYCGRVLFGAKHNRSRDRRERSLCWITRKLKRKLKYKGGAAEELSNFRVDKEGSCTSRRGRGPSGSGRVMASP